MIKYKLGAVIPTTQYGNLQPEIELEGDDEDQLHSQASAFIEGIWQKYGSSPLTINTNSGGKRLTTFTGEEIIYNDATHKYTDLAGNPLMSGSVYADSNSAKFDSSVLVPKTAKSWEVDEKDLGQLWSMNGKVSTEYGSAIHTALEIWHKYKDMGAKIQEAKGLEYNYCLPKNPHLRDIILSFEDKFGSTAEPEVLVSDVVNKMAGQIDRLQIIDANKMVCRVGDYKTNNDMDKKKLEKYQHQLSFYAQILKNKGWTVEGLDIFHFSEGWEKVELEVLDVKI